MRIHKLAPPSTYAVTAAPSRTAEQLIRIARQQDDGLRYDRKRPLSEVQNAHSTNTEEHLRDALKGPYTQLECDVRMELNPPHALECRHDRGHEPGNNLTLAEWLAVGQASGRILKLDVKEPEHMQAIIDECRRSGVPPEHLNFNADERTLERWGETLRREFPGAMLSVNPTESQAPLSAAQLDRLKGFVRRFGEPTTVVLRTDLIDARVVAALEPLAPISVWNALGGPEIADPEAHAAGLRELGCTGVIDIRKTPGAREKVDIVVDKSKGLFNDATDRAGDLLSGVLGRFGIG
ncbi:MAG: hypothetical protein JNK82_27525 [Myxococcaceae bacterium]|nr:hypothetical protein [Myxococcaceae bacterium]